MDLKATIQKLVAQEVQKALDAALSGLLSEPTPKQASAAKSKDEAKPKGKRGGKRGPRAKSAGGGRAVSRATVETAWAASKFLALNPGSKASQIAEAIGLAEAKLLAPATAYALSQGWITKDGERAKTVYHPAAVPAELPEPEAPAAPSNATPATTAPAAAPAFTTFSGA